MDCRYITVSTCNLNQWALDFDGNLLRTMESIQEAKLNGSNYRLGPELELSGYGCEDHFLELDTIYHCWESIYKILQSNITNNILCDIGMPILHNSIRYNCRIYLFNNKILLIRPKLWLANDGNYHETRYFTNWKKTKIEEYILPSNIQLLTKQIHVPIGNAYLKFIDNYTIASETCEELFTPLSPHIYLNLSGVEIIGNGSGSHHELRKLNKRIYLLRNATEKSGGLYLYSNQQGCDGSRLYYDGCAIIIMNGKILKQSSQFNITDVEVITATIDLNDVTIYRSNISSRNEQASYIENDSQMNMIPSIFVPYPLRTNNLNDTIILPTPIIQKVFYHLPEEEIGFGPACWLWDYLRRSGANGFFIPLSGGADSASVLMIVTIMCHLILKEIKRTDIDELNSICNQNNKDRIITDLNRILGKNKNLIYYKNMQVNELTHLLICTAYMGSINSSQETRDLADNLAKEINTYHLNISIGKVTNAIVHTFSLATGKTPSFDINNDKKHASIQDLALQNIQARTRMIMSYLFAQLLPWVRNFSDKNNNLKSSFLLVLSSGNVDECLRGYLTKYDCSSGDLNPIGGISKVDLKRFLIYARDTYDYKTLNNIIQAKPSAELRPRNKDNNNITNQQLDEDEMGMTYDELSLFGKLRKIHHYGPYFMFKKIISSGYSIFNNLSNNKIADKVKTFFYYYSVNRHKMTTLTPSYHAEAYSPDDNRFDLRPFLYNNKWTRQFQSIDNTIIKEKEDK